MITPEHRIKFQIENQIDMAGLNVPAGKPMQELVDNIFAAIFNKATVASVQEYPLLGGWGVRGNGAAGTTV